MRLQIPVTLFNFTPGERTIRVEISSYNFPEAFDFTSLERYFTEANINSLLSKENKTKKLIFFECLEKVDLLCLSKFLLAFFVC